MPNIKAAAQSKIRNQDLLRTTLILAPSERRRKKRKDRSRDRLEIDGRR